METTVVYWVCIGIMEKENGIYYFRGLGFRDGRTKACIDLGILE